MALIILRRSIRLESLDLPFLVFAAGLFVYQGVDRVWSMGTGLFIILSGFSRLGQMTELSVPFLFVRRLAARFVMFVGWILPIVSMSYFSWQTVGHKKAP